MLGNNQIAASNAASNAVVGKCKGVASPSPHLRESRCRWRDERLSPEVSPVAPAEPSASSSSAVVCVCSREDEGDPVPVFRRLPRPPRERDEFEPSDVLLLLAVPWPAVAPACPRVDTSGGGSAGGGFCESVTAASSRGVEDQQIDAGAYRANIQRTMSRLFRTGSCTGGAGQSSRCSVWSRRSSLISRCRPIGSLSGRVQVASAFRIRPTRR